MPKTCYFTVTTTAANYSGGTNNDDSVNKVGMAISISHSVQSC